MRKVLVIIIATALLGLVSNPAWSADTLKVTTPNGGQEYTTGKKYTIKWNNGGNSNDNVKIELLKSRKVYKTIKRRTRNDGKYRWKIPSSIKTGNRYKIRVTSKRDSSITDSSNKNFTITKAGDVNDSDDDTNDASNSLEVTAPNGGESWTRGNRYTIKWDKGNGKKKVKIELLQSGKASLTIHKNTKNDGKHRWKIPRSVAAGSSYKIKITSKKDSSITDSSDSNFTVDASATQTGRIRVTNPNGGESWNVGEKREIRWKSSNAGSLVRIKLYKSDTLVKTITSRTSNDGSYSWSIPKSIEDSSEYTIRISSVTLPDIVDSSNAVFTLSTADTSPIGLITSPSGGEVWETEETRSITWNLSSGNSVYIDLYKSNSLLFRIERSKISNDGDYNWTIPSDLGESSSYQIEVSSYTYYSNRTKSDIIDSDRSGNFTIESATSSSDEEDEEEDEEESSNCNITVTDPNHGNEIWNTTNNRGISWTSSGASENVDIYLYKNDALCKTITTGTSNDGHYSWLNAAHRECNSGNNQKKFQIQIVDSNDSTCSDLSDNKFSFY